MIDNQVLILKMLMDVLSCQQIQCQASICKPGQLAWFQASYHKPVCHIHIELIPTQACLGVTIQARDQPVFILAQILFNNSYPGKSDILIIKLSSQEIP